VGIQITRNGAAVTFGTTVPVVVTTNAGTYNIPLVAQYYQTSANVKAGQANGTATFTMTYN
jgi:type 1 fimbria pilin